MARTILLERIEQLMIFNSLSLVTACLGKINIRHYDGTRAHGPLELVVSLSLGGPRPFRLRARRYRQSSEASSSDNAHALLVDLMLPPGPVLSMTGDVRELCKHWLPLSTTRTAVT
jgi:alkylated DNA repair dioxygenase AlkB